MGWIIYGFDFISRIIYGHVFFSRTIKCIAFIGKPVEGVTFQKFVINLIMIKIGRRQVKKSLFSEECIFQKSGFISTSLNTRLMIVESIEK